MPCGPKRVPDRYVVPPSNGAPSTATSYSPQRRTSSTYGALRKVLIPAKCGSSPRENVGIVRSLMESAPGRPYSRPRAISSCHLVVGSLASAATAKAASGPYRSCRVGSVSVCSTCSCW